MIAELRRVPFPVRGQRLGYGLGIALIEGEPIAIEGHSGGGFGFLADMWWNRDYDIGGVMLTNSTAHTLMGTIREALADGVDAPPLQTAATRAFALTSEDAATRVAIEAT